MSGILLLKYRISTNIISPKAKFYSDKENVHAFIFPNKITAFTSALYGIGASMYKDLISDYMNDFLLSDNNVIVVTIFGNIVATMTFLQPVLASMDDIYDENSKPRNHKTLDKGM